MIRVTMTSELSQKRSNAITYFTCSPGDVFFSRIVHRSFFFYPVAASMFMKSARNLWVRAFTRSFEMTWIFKARNTVKTWQLSWCSAVIYRKHWQRAFELKFRLTVFLFFLETCGKDHGNSFSWLVEKRIWIVCIEALWLSAFKTFSCALTNNRIILKPGVRFFKLNNIFYMIFEFEDYR